MGLDAEEGLAHDDKRQDGEYEIGGQIVEVQPVVEHEPVNKWVEGKSQPADEMGKEYNPFVGFGGRDNLPRVWEPVCDICGQVSGFPDLRDVLLRNKGGHPHASRSGHVRVFLWRRCELGCWSSSTREWMGREEEGVGKKEESLSLYKGGRNCVPPLLPGKTRLFPKRRD